MTQRTSGTPLAATRQIDMQSLLLDRDLQAALPPEVQMLLWSLEVVS